MRCDAVMCCAGGVLMVLNSDCVIEKVWFGESNYKSQIVKCKDMGGVVL
jgi:hypothetical protein